MSKIYTVNNGESNTDQIPSIEYINELTKMVEDALVSINPEFNGFASIKTKTEELPVGIKEMPTISASDIVTDSSHKFVNKAVIETMVDKPTKFEVEQSIEEAKKEIEDKIEKIYTRIINTPDVINKLRDINTLLNEEDLVDGVLSILAYKTNNDDFNHHTASQNHINNNDRKALNILLKCLISGFANWDAKEGDFNAIKNKPESFLANGGNADTVANHGIRDLINRDDYDIVVGSNLENHTEDSCDFYAKDCDVDTNKLNKAIECIRKSGMILFKRGYYNLDSIELDCKCHIIINGADSRLTWLYLNTTKMNNVSCNNIAFNKSKINIKSNCEFRNVRFTNCEIILNNSENCKIIDCVFNNCTIKVKGSIMNNIIVFNRLIDTTPMTYIGGNNIIKDNL